MLHNFGLSVWWRAVFLLLTGCILKHSFICLIWSSKAKLNDWQLQNEVNVQLAEDILRHKYKLVSPKEPRLLFTVVTVKRSVWEQGGYEPHYLTQVIARFSKLLHRYRVNQDGPEIGIILCNVDEYPEYHTEAKRLKNHTGLGEFVKYRKPPSIKDVFRKETRDYVFCLEKSFTFSSVEYAILVEDDALPNQNAFEVLNNMLQQFFELGCNSVKEYVVFMKLYYPERLQSYISLEAHRWQELCLLSAILATLCTIITKRRGIRTAQRWCLFYCSFLLLGCWIGRYYFLQLRSLLSPWLHRVVPAPTCCTPATLYTRQTYRNVTQFLSTTNASLAKDELLDMMTKRLPFTGVLLEPNIFSHIGVYSSVRGVVTDPKYVN